MDVTQNGISRSSIYRRGSSQTRKGCLSQNLQKYKEEARRRRGKRVERRSEARRGSCQPILTSFTDFIIPLPASPRYGGSLSLRTRTAPRTVLCT